MHVASDVSTLEWLEVFPDGVCIYANKKNTIYEIYSVYVDAGIFERECVFSVVTTCTQHSSKVCPNSVGENFSIVGMILFSKT